MNYDGIGIDDLRRNKKSFSTVVPTVISRVFPEDAGTGSDLAA
jgi:hypothetical protein